MTREAIDTISSLDSFKSWKKEKGLVQAQQGKGWYFDKNGNPISDMPADIIKLFLLNNKNN